MPVANQLEQELKTEIEGKFNLEELEGELCFPLGIPWDDVHKERAGKSRTVLEIINYTKRRNLLSNLIAQCKEARPEGNWPEEAPQSRISFTNRNKELNLLLKNSDKENSQHNKYFIVHAPAKYGKSTFLEEVKKQLDEKKWLCCYAKVTEDDNLQNLIFLLSANIDIPLSGDHIKGESLGQSIETKFGTDGPPAGKGLAVIIDLDGTPSITLLEALLNEFIPGLEEHLNTLFVRESKSLKFYVIIAGRYLHKRIITKSINRKSLPLIGLELSPFQFNDILTTVNKDFKQVGTERKREIAAVALYKGAGHPGCIAKILKDFREKRHNVSNYLEEEQVWSQCLKPVAQEIFDYLHEVISNEDVLYLISFFRYLNDDILEAILEKHPIANVDSQDLTDILTQSTLFTRDRNIGLIKDNIVRKLLVLHSYHHKPEKFLDYCKTAKQICINNISAESSHPEHWAGEYFYQSLQQFINQINRQSDRKKLKENIFPDISDIIKVYLNLPKIKNKPPKGKWDKIDDLITQMRYEEEKSSLESWELQFMANYYLREEAFKNEDDDTGNCPFSNMINEIECAARQIIGEDKHVS